MKRRDVMGSGLGDGIDKESHHREERSIHHSDEHEKKRLESKKEVRAVRQMTLEERVKAIEDFLWGKK